MSSFGVVLQLAGSGEQPTEGATEVGVTYHGAGKRGHRCPYLGKYIRGGGPGSIDVWVRYVGDDTSHWEYFGRIIPQGGPQAEGTETVEGG